MRRIWGGVESEANQALISFGLGESPLRPLTLRETRVNGFLIISKSVLRDWQADRSRGAVGVPCRELLVVVVCPSVSTGESGAIYPRGDQRRDV